MIDPTQAPEKVGDRDQFRLALTGCLSVADDEAFMRLLWALNALQSDRVDVALPLLRGVPAAAATKGILGKFAIYPWELETLANELLSAPKHFLYRSFDCGAWSSAANLANLLRNLENEEYASQPDRDIFQEIGRIGARQFDWQRGFLTVAEFYRSAFIYGQGVCADYFEETHGLTVSTMMFIGFALMSVFMSAPSLEPTRDLNQMYAFGVSSTDLERALSRLRLPLSDLRQETEKLRGNDGPTAYKASVLRRYPCMLVGIRNRRLMAPLPELVANRVTSGLYYDVVGGGGPIRADIGKRFETYAHAYLTAMLPESDISKEWCYKTPRGRYDTPDVIVRGKNGAVLAAIECKASRMGIGALFGQNMAADRGYHEISKGVYQLWRFFSHSRQGLTGSYIAPDAPGILLTLDEWFAGRSGIIDQVITRATKLAGQDPLGIAAEDRRPIAFCSISELEGALSTGTEASLLSAFASASGAKRGWIFTSVHAEIDEPKTGPKRYPFEKEIDELLPWYGNLRLDVKNPTARDGLDR